MARVRCPICGAQVEGNDSEELTIGLREHMVKSHEDLEARSTAGPAGEFDIPKQRGAEATDHRFHEAEMRREEETWDPPEGSEVPKRPEGLGDWVRKSLGTDNEVDPKVRAKEEWTTGQGYPTMMRENMHALRREDEKEAHKNDIVIPYSLKNESQQESPSRYIIDCPMCQAKVFGNDDEELSDALKKHMMETHKIKEIKLL